MTSVQFILQPLPSTDEQFTDRIREVSDRVNKFGFGTYRIFDQLKIPVKEIVIGPNHIGVLLEDGKAFRVTYSINSDRLDLTKNDTTKSGGSVSTSTSSNSKASGPSNSRQLARSRARLMRTSGRSGSNGQNTTSRSTGVIIGSGSSTRPLVTVPATYVPEELISQAEVVLQGKSRSLIVRELQRTNLDVNLAVNNLLSRDDEDAEDTEEGGDNYVPEDLISLLDNGFHGENNSVIIDPADGLFTEEIFSNYSSIRNLLFDRIRSERNQNSNSSAGNTQSRSSNNALTTSTSLSAQISNVSAEREAFSRWRDRQYYVPRRWPNIDDYVWEKEGDAKKKDVPTMNSPIWISEELQPWPSKNGFKRIAALYSEFIAVSDNGELHQWKWVDVEPYKSEIENIYHPKTLPLNLIEKVQDISADFIRCSVVTESDRVATWIDEQLGYIGAKLEHSATLFSEFIMDPIVSIHVCSLYTVVRTENNSIYWWGVLPFDQRRYVSDKYRAKTKKPLKNTTMDISVGNQVIMKKCPKYQTGSIGFNCANGIPKVGQLLNSVWDTNDVCRFKILNIIPVNNGDKSPHITMCTTNSSNCVDKEHGKSVTSASVQSCTNQGKGNLPSFKESTDRIDMPPPPSPASSTCSDTGSVTSHKRTKRMLAKEDSSENKRDEEIWQLKDVVFVEDKIGPIGRVLKVDGDFVAVRFPLPTSAPLGNENKEDDWQQCRLLRREDVQIYKNTVTSRSPDWIQKLPKKININYGGDITTQLLAVAIDLQGVHIIKRINSKIHYSVYNLYNSKQEQNCTLPTDSTSFMGAQFNNISMICSNDCSGSTSMIMLRDGNRALFPMAKNCMGLIKDPQWFDLPPVKTMTLNVISLNMTNSGNQKYKVCMGALLFDTQKLMQHILRCDVKNAFAVIQYLEKINSNDIIPIIEERCDGARNIIHACVVMCSPTTNKDGEEKKGNSIANVTSPRTMATSSVFPNNVGPSNIDSSNCNLNSNSPSSSSNFSNISSTINTCSSQIIREGRTVSLRELNRFITSETESSNKGNSASTGNSGSNEESYLAPWNVESSVNVNGLGMNNMMLNISTEEDANSGVLNGQSSSVPNYIFDPIQRRENATLILQKLCSSIALRPYLYKLLSSKDAQGQTPFMLAVYGRAYEAGLILLKTILTISEKDSLMKEAMIFPSSAPPDQSPLHVICYNDTCSFTWTGADHINQNIFECKTCGLTDSLCCCTECARVCHKGHDCKLKRTSPTAYCDCWEKCKCKALIAGNQTKRFSLLCKLVSCTDLVTKFNSKGESILLFLIQTVGRQSVEQRQYRVNARTRAVANNNNNSTSGRKSMDIEANMPDHDLEPPKFARRALERILIDWHAVRSMIMTGVEKNECVAAQQTSNSTDNTGPFNYSMFFHNQDGSTLLDKFTHNLLVKCSTDHLDTLLVTLVREMQNDTTVGRMEDAELVSRRFVRSVARVFVIFNLEKFPNPERRKSLIMSHKHIQSCIKVFQTLHKIAIQELCETAESLIAPVRLGVVRPTAPFMASTTIENSDDLFNVEPLTPSMQAPLITEASVPNEAVIRDQSSTFGFQTNYEGLRDSTGTDDNLNRERNTPNRDDDIIEARGNEDTMQDDESDNEYAFNEPDTESDSDDNQSNQDAQRSVQTGATAGSETDIGVLFLEDESGDSSPQEDEGSEDGETDDHEEEEFNYSENQLERRNTSANSRNDVAPQFMQWAIRSRDATRSSVRVPTSSNLIFIDPMALRRSTVPANSTVTAPPQEHHTMSTTSSNLARGFGVILRQISELLCNLSLNITNDIETTLKIKIEEAIELQVYIEKCFKATWSWMFSVMDSTEAQLKFGAYLTNYADPSHPLHPLNLSAQNNFTQSNNSANSPSGLHILGSSSRKDFFTYCLSLMRAHTSEHRDALPVLDITAQRHVAFVLDAFIYYLRNDTNFYERNVGIANNTFTNNIEVDETDDELSNLTNEEVYTEVMPSGLPAINISGFTAARRPSFFTRSDSTLSLGCVAPDGFDLPLDVAIPLADKPHLLQPNSKRADLFVNLSLNMYRTTENQVSSEAGLPNYLPTRLCFSSYKTTTLDQSTSTSTDLPIKQIQITPKAPINCGINSNIEVEAGSNVYLQFKKKQYIDDAKMGIPVEYDNEKMDTDNSTYERKLQQAANATTRPDVIITPNKSQTVNLPSKYRQDTSLPINRSVIVRAGVAGENNCDDCGSLETEKANTSQLFADENKTTNETKSSTSFMFPTRGQYLCQKILDVTPSWNFLLGRWKLTLDLFSRVFMDDVGMEHGSVLPELRGFPVKEMRFRRSMEKLRNNQQRDLILCKLERNRDSLITQTFKELNAQFGNQNRRGCYLTFNRVKVTFKDEPGEGSGVARSFYTSISEALLASSKMPNLESVQIGNNNSNNKYGVPFSSILKNRTSSRDIYTLQRRGTGNKILWRTARERKTLNYDARPYVPVSSNTDNANENINDHLTVHLQQLGERLHSKIYSINPPHASKITGMLLEIPTPQLLTILSSEEILRQKINEAVDIIKQKIESVSTSQSKKLSPVVMLEQCHVEDNEPLFYMPGKRGFYTPRQGYGSLERVNAFRNIGRLIGLCLLQNELLPLFLQRHVIKYILGRKIKFHDLAFFDPTIYESFRQLILNSQKEDNDETLSRMELFFAIDLMQEEGGGNIELIAGGRDVQVTQQNLFEYIRRYTEYRLIKAQEKALEAIRAGVFDVLPDNCMQSLTAEDFRLLLNGVGNIDVATLISYTTFNDESNEGSDKLLKFKRWFWSIVEKMNIMERQDLVYFWTGSPALPASEEGFQPLPSVTIRPADDSHLPTANTCISRLYIPLYSSKSILRNKLLLAIKSKNFGFV